MNKQQQLAVADVDQRPTTIGGVVGSGMLAASDSSRPAAPVRTSGW